MLVNLEDVKKIAIGSLFLGGGGGGDIREGLSTARRALELGEVQIIPLSEVGEKEGVILTISGVGSPASDTAYYSEDVYEKILYLIQSQEKKKIIGFIPCEMGASSSFEPFIPAARLNIPVINSACDGRAHPFGIMGSLGLEKGDKNITVQAGAGGRESTNTYVEVLLTGSIETTSDLIRNAAAKAGGAIAVARNPVAPSWLETSGATGAYDLAYRLGEVYLTGKTVEEKIAAACSVVEGNIICQGRVENYTLCTENALDHGSFTVSSENDKYQLYFFNEYMAVDKNGERLHTFPDLITTIDTQTGEILTTAQIENGCNITVVAASKEHMLLGKGLLYRDVYQRIENILNIEMQKYIDEIYID